jgi:hypothetical protein
VKLIADAWKVTASGTWRTDKPIHLAAVFMHIPPIGMVFFPQKKPCSRDRFLWPLFV